MNGPLTVGIITYNEEQGIQDCLESLQHLKNQNINFQIVIVDNNSSDKTLEKAEKTLRKFQLEFILLKRTQNNLAEARNDILNQATTRWIYMMDADCRLDSTTWNSLVLNWKNDDQIAARAGAQKFPDHIEILILLDEMRKGYLGHFGSAQMKFSGGPQTVEHVSTTHVLYDKKALDHVGGFNPFLNSSAEDLDLSLRLRQKGYQLHFNPESYVWHEQVSSWKQWAYKAFRNGIWQTRLIAYNFEILKTRRPWPGIFLLSGFFVPVEILAIIITSYLILIFCLACNSKLPVVRKVKLFHLYGMTHFLYATGEVLGIFLSLKDWIIKRKLPNSTKNWCSPQPSQ